MLLQCFQFACCGKNGPQDYTAIALPDSCCTTTSTFGNVIGGRCTIDVANKGCSSAIAELYEKWNKPIAGVAIGIACIEVCIILNCDVFVLIRLHSQYSEGFCVRIVSSSA